MADGIRPYGSYRSYAIATRWQIFSRRIRAMAFALLYFFGQGLALA
jgi:hypothetical protein